MKSERLIRVGGVIAALATMQGCIAYTVADTAVGVVGTAVETTADIAGGAVDLVVGDDDDD
ncbi:MAG: hypothetical protein AAFR17_11900 [Pseudomonadota bacterium]